MERAQVRARCWRGPDAHGSPADTDECFCMLRYTHCTPHNKVINTSKLQLYSAIWCISKAFRYSAFTNVVSENMFLSEIPVVFSRRGTSKMMILVRDGLASAYRTVKCRSFFTHSIGLPLSALHGSKDPRCQTVCLLAPPLPAPHSGHELFRPTHKMYTAPTGTKVPSILVCRTNTAQHLTFALVSKQPSPLFYLLNAVFINSCAFYVQT